MEPIYDIRQRRRHFFARSSVIARLPVSKWISVAILAPSRNVWRIERAGRFATLVDAAAFFGAVREAALQARHSILIMGWDIDSRTRLVGDGTVEGSKRPNKGAIATALAAVGGALWFWRKKSSDDELPSSGS